MKVIQAKDIQQNHFIINIGKVEKVDIVMHFIRIFVKPIVINNEGIYYLKQSQELLIQD